MDLGSPQQPFPARRCQQGFILPVVLGVGLITLCLALLMIERSSQNRRTVIAQTSSTQSLAAAEAGVAQLQALLNRYRALALYCSEPSASDPCKKQPTWQAMTQKYIDPCSTTPDAPHELVQAYARQTWRTVSADPAAGQFRLIRYTYRPQPSPSPGEPQGTGELIVEGRTHPEDTARTVTTRLKVNFNLLGEPGRVLPGLWIAENDQTSVFSTVTLATQVHDSTCPAHTSATAVRQLQAQLQPSYAYQSIPGSPLPLWQSVVSGESASPQVGVYALSPVTEGMALPKAGQSSAKETKGDRRLLYRIAANGGMSIELTRSAVLKLGTGAETVVLDLAGGLTVKDGGTIQIADGSKLILYARGAVTLVGEKGTPAIQQEGTPAAHRVQIYVYPPVEKTAQRDVILRGTAPLHLALVAPGSKVTSDAPIQGSIWAKSWEGTGGSLQESLQATELKVLWPLRLSPITAWQRESF